MCFTWSQGDIVFIHVDGVSPVGFGLGVVFTLFFAVFYIGHLRTRRGTFPGGKRNVALFLGHRGHANVSCRGRFVRLGGGGLNGKGALEVKIGCALPPLRKGRTITSTVGQTGCRPLFNGRLTSCGMASSRLGKTYFCLIDKRKNPSPKTVKQVNGVRLRRSRCTCSVMLHLTHGLVAGKTGIRVVVRSTGSKVQSTGCLGGDGQRAYVNDPVPFGRIHHLGRQDSGVGALFGRSGCTCGQTVFIRISDQGGKRRASIFFCRRGGGSRDGRLTGAVQAAFARGCGGRRPKQKFAKAISKQGLCILERAAPTSIFIRLNGVRGDFSRRQVVLDSGHRTLTG